MGSKRGLDQPGSVLSVNMALLTAATNLVLAARRAKRTRRSLPDAQLGAEFHHLPDVAPNYGLGLDDFDARLSRVLADLPGEHDLKGIAEGLCAELRSDAREDDRLSLAPRRQSRLPFRA